MALRLPHLWHRALDEETQALLEVADLDMLRALGVLAVEGPGEALLGVDEDLGGVAEDDAAALEILAEEADHQRLELLVVGGGWNEEELKESVVKDGLLAWELHEPAHGGGVRDSTEEEAAIEDLVTSGDAGVVWAEGGDVLDALEKVGEMAQVVFDGLGCAVGGSGEGAEGGNVDERASAEVADIQKEAGAGGDAPGGLRRAVGEAEAGGEVVGRAAGDVSEGRGSGEEHEAGDSLIEGTIAAVADDTVEMGAQLGDQLDGVIGALGLTDGEKVVLFAEMGGGGEEGGVGACTPGPGVDDEKKFFCHSFYIPRRKDG